MESGARVRVVAGTFLDVSGPVSDVVTQPMYLDVTLPHGISLHLLYKCFVLYPPLFSFYLLVLLRHHLSALLLQTAALYLGVVRSSIHCSCLPFAVPFAVEMSPRICSVIVVRLLVRT